ncbi:DUF4019 domain-containing protein [Janthinobacterium svalbardensis]|uniref:DUF4019 domain-containing protein n=1 Tax=Janthinobacterium svalbardensis TaxID=368607 RepID=UPI002FCD87B5
MSLLQFSSIALRLQVGAKLIALFLFMLSALMVGPAQAQTAASAENVAKSFVTHLEIGGFGEIYDEDLGPTFKQGVKKDQFVSQMGMLKIQTGGTAQARQLVGGQSFTQAPNGLTGDFYYVRFRTKFPSGMVFQDVYLERVSGGWKISGYWIFAAPPV